MLVNITFFWYNIKELIKLKVGYFMDDLFDIVEDETLSFDDDKNENDIKKKTEIKDEPAKKESILEKYGENLCQHQAPGANFQPGT